VAGSNAERRRYRAEIDETLAKTYAATAVAERPQRRSRFARG
jgi:hypothetical protein